MQKDTVEVLKDMEEGKYSGNVVQVLQYPEGMCTPEFQAMYDRFAKRILWIDGNVVPGAVQMNTAWYKSVPERDPIFPEHVHPDGELIGFFGSDPEDPYDLHAEIEIGINGERRLLTKTTLVYIPGGVPHMPMRILKVDKPVFHFSLMVGAEYNGGAYK